MKFTLSWLKEHLDTDATHEHIAQRLTDIGLEVESCTHLGEGLERFTVAHILSAAPHPDADKLQVCQVDTHQGERQIVCGAPNARAGIKVALADIGDVIPTNGLKIKAAKIRGVESAGMLCSARELGLGDEHEGIMELDADAQVGDALINTLGLNDTLFDIAITPNRGDCLGIYGIARDLAASGLGTLREHTHTPATYDEGITLQLDTADCPHFVAYTIEGVKNAQSPLWLQRKLESVGLRPINALVDVTNYFTIAYGRPLHVYDAQHVQGGITVRHSRKGESLDALNDRSYELPDGLCVIADDVSVLGLGGVVGGVASGCTEQTTRVILESAWFDPVSIARTGQTLMIDTDARHRFERSVDPHSTEALAIRAAQMIVELCGGNITQCSIAGKAHAPARTIAYAPAMMEQKTGLAVEEAQQRRILEALGCTVSDDWHICPPSWRADMEDSADIVEEITRIVGYDNVPEVALPSATPHARNSNMEDRARDVLLKRGLDEVVHFAFTSQKHAQDFAGDAALIHVKNPISSELSVMRPHLFADMLPAVARNADRGQKSMALFEIGAVFFGISPDKQPVRVGGLRCGESALHWRDKPHADDIYDAKADLFALLDTLGVNTQALMLSRDVPHWYHPGKAGRLSLGPKNVLGYFGELHPRILRQFDIDMPVVAFECALDALPRKAKAKKASAFKPTEFQASRRDFAFIADDTLPAGELKAALEKAHKELITKVELFDVYTGEHMEAGKKSLAFSATLQAADRTLSEEDITQASDAIIRAAEKKGATLR